MTTLQGFALLPRQLLLCLFMEISFWYENIKMKELF